MSNSAISLAGDDAGPRGSSRGAEQPVCWLFLALLTLAPLPFAGETPWAWPLLTATTGVLLILWGIAVGFGSNAGALTLNRIWLSAALYICVVMWAMIQARAILPGALLADPWTRADAMLSAPGAHTLSLDPDRSYAAALKLLAYAGAFLLAFQLARARASAILLMRGLVAAAVAYTVYGMTVEFLDLNSVLWFPKSRNIGQLSSTFLDRNVFAGYAGICLIAATALLFRPKMRDGDLESDMRFALRAVLDYFFSRSVVGITAAAVLFSAVVLTHSRAGLAATVSGLVVFLLAVMSGWRRRTAALLTLLALALGGMLILSVAGGGLLERLATAPEAAIERGQIYRLTGDAIAEAPLTGTGYGTFESVFAARRDGRLRAPITHGHNMYLENALELGIPAAAALAVAIGWIGVFCSVEARTFGREAFFPAMGAAIVVVVAVHSLFDSVLRVPAMAMTFAALLGVAAARTMSAPTDPGGR